MTRHGIFTREEMVARSDIHMENYCKVIHIEAQTMVDMVQRHILHAASRYSGGLCETILRKRQALPGVTCRVEEALADGISQLSRDLLEQCATLKTDISTVPAAVSQEELLQYYRNVVFSDMSALRATIDHLETLIAADYWPFPSYYDLLFYA